MITETGKHPARIFIGIPIEHLDADPVAVAMRKAILDCLPCGVRFSNERIRQVILQSLGNTAPEAVEGLADQLVDIAGRHQPFTLNLHSMGIFDDSNVVWAGIGGDVEALEGLQTDVAAAAQQLGFHTADFPFHPHIIVGRINGYVGEEEFEAVKTRIRLQGMHLKSFDCTGIALNMAVRTESRISDSAFRTAHSTLRRMPLGGVQQVGV